MRVKSLVPALLALVPAGGRVLQLGAATSFLAVRLARQHPGGAVYAVDPLKEWVAYLSTLVLPSVMVGETNPAAG
eukprot:9117431-Pyramimonas_sp.AAC.2